MSKATKDMIGGVSTAVVSCAAVVTVLVLGLVYWDGPWWATVLLSILVAGPVGGVLGAILAALLLSLGRRAIARHERAWQTAGLLVLGLLEAGMAVAFAVAGWWVFWSTSCWAIPASLALDFGAVVLAFMAVCFIKTAVQRKGS